MRPAQRRKRVGCSSKYKGVTKVEGGYRAVLQRRRKLVWSGYFTSEVDAARAYDDAARKLYGKNARLNFPKKGELSAQA